MPLKVRHYVWLGCLATKRLNLLTFLCLSLIQTSLAFIVYVVWDVDGIVVSVLACRRKVQELKCSNLASMEGYSRMSVPQSSPVA